MCEAIGVPAQSVGRRLGKKRKEASWVSGTGEPTDYVSEQTHPNSRKKRASSQLEPISKNACAVGPRKSSGNIVVLYTDRRSEFAQSESPPKSIMSRIAVGIVIVDTLFVVSLVEFCSSRRTAACGSAFLSLRNRCPTQMRNAGVDNFRREGSIKLNDMKFGSCQQLLGWLRAVRIAACRLVALPFADVQRPLVKGWSLARAGIQGIAECYGVK